MEPSPQLCEKITPNSGVVPDASTVAVRLSMSTVNETSGLGRRGRGGGGAAVVVLLVLLRPGVGGACLPHARQGVSGNGTRRLTVCRPGMPSNIRLTLSDTGMKVCTQMQV